MECKECRQRLSEYLDQELSAELRQAVERHLAECTDCVRELEALRQMVAGVKELLAAAVSEGFRRAVWEKIDAPRGWARLRRLLEPGWMPVPVGLFATVLVVLIMVHLKQVPEPASATKIGALSDTSLRQENQGFVHQLGTPAQR